MQFFAKERRNELPQSKPDGFASSLWEGASGIVGRFLAQVQSRLHGSTPSVLPQRGNPHSPFCRCATSSPGRGKSALKGTAFGGGGKVSGSAIRRPLGGAVERSETEGVAFGGGGEVSNQSIKACGRARGRKTKRTGSEEPVRYGRGSKFRTHGTRFWRPLLYQLSYTPIGIR